MCLEATRMLGIASSFLSRRFADNGHHGVWGKNGDVYLISPISTISGQLVRILKELTRLECVRDELEE